MKTSTQFAHKYNLWNISPVKEATDVRRAAVHLTVMLFNHAGLMLAAQK